MIHFRAPLLGGLCCIGLMFQFVAVDIVHATTTVEMQDIGDTAVMPSADYVLPVPAEEAAAQFGYDERDETGDEAIDVAEDDAAPAATGGQATTEFYGDRATQERPAWDAPAKMNPDYAADETAAPSANDAAAQSEPSESATPAESAQTEVAEDAAPAPTGGQATIEYYGGTEAPSNPAWAAPAKMNPDYSSSPAAAPEAAPPAAAEAPAEPPAAAPTQAAEEPPPPTGGQATTEYFGGTAAPSNPAWAAPAKMNPDYSAQSPAAAPAATEPAAAASNASACRDAVETAAKAALLHFAEDSAAISPDSQTKLTALAGALKDCDGVVVEVHGHTDSVGSADANRVLSEFRAKKIVDFLTSAGVDAARLKAIGDGKANPIADNRTAEGRRMNRRVEFTVSAE